MSSIVCSIDLYHDHFSLAVSVFSWESLRRVQDVAETKVVAYNNKYLHLYNNAVLRSFSPN